MGTYPGLLAVAALLFGAVLPAPAAQPSPQPIALLAFAPQTTAPAVPPTVPIPSAPAPAASVESIISMRDRHAAAPTDPRVAPHGKSYSIAVAGGDWVDTGITLSAGERVRFRVSGSQTLADGRIVTPDGLDRGWKDLLRQFPLNQARTGALIGRVTDNSASVPFSIGADATLAMPTSGRLFLRANLSPDLAGTGSFTAKTTFPEPGASPATTPAAGVPLTPTRATSATPLPSPATPLPLAITPSAFDPIPRRVGDEAGNPGDMVNFALVGSEDQVLAAFKSAGWVAVDKNVGDALLHGLLSTLNREAYTAMPMSTLFLFGRPQDLSFARGDPLTVAAERHHLRVWKSAQTVAGRPLWVGSATHDIGFEKDQRNGKTTHKIDPDIDAERQFLLSSFDAAGAFSVAAYITPADPLRQARTATGGEFHSDGRILVMQLQ